METLVAKRGEVDRKWCAGRLGFWWDVGVFGEEGGLGSGGCWGELVDDRDIGDTRLLVLGCPCSGGMKLDVTLVLGPGNDSSSM